MSYFDLLVVFFQTADWQREDMECECGMRCTVLDQSVVRCKHEYLQ